MGSASSGRTRARPTSPPASTVTFPRSTTTSGTPGKSIALESVALTNIPNLTGLKALASRDSGLNPSTGDITMSFLKTMASVLGVTAAEPTEAAVEAAARRYVRRFGHEVRHVRHGRSRKGRRQDARRRRQGSPGHCRACRASRRLKYVPVETFNIVNAELSRMKAAQSLALVEQGKAEGKISPALEGWAKGSRRKRSRSLQEIPRGGPGPASRQDCAGDKRHAAGRRQKAKLDDTAKGALPCAGRFRR